MVRISELPQDIIHHIYSFLPVKDVVKTSLLSNLWHSNFLSYPNPNLDFDQSLFRGSNNARSNEENTLDFLKYVNDSLLRLQKHNLDVKSFRLNVSCDFWEALKISRRVKEVLGFCRNIQVLELCNCDLEWCLPGKDVNFPCLNKLTLDRVDIYEFNLEKLLNSCPEVSDFRYDRCFCLTSLSISGLTKLKNLKVYLFGHGDIVAIDASTLESLHISSGCCCDVKLVIGQNLKSVVLENGGAINNKFLEDVVSKSPNLESLTLDRLVNLNRLNLASHHLRILTIASCHNLKDCKIDAPNLHTFRYSGFSPQDICFVSDIRCWRRIELELLNELYLLSDLKQLLNGKKIKHVALSIGKGFVNSRKVSAISPCCEVEHLRLRVDSSGFGSMENTVIGLVLMCQAKYLNAECNLKSPRILKGISKNMPGLKRSKIERIKESPFIHLEF